MLGRNTRWVVGALALVCLVLIGPSATRDDLPDAEPLPAGAAAKIVPNRVMTWNICNPCGAKENAGRAADIATYAPQVIGLQEACVRDVERIRDYLRRLYGLVYHVTYGSVLRNWSRCGGLPWHAGGYGQAILSAAPATDGVTKEYPDGGSEDRGFMAVTTEVDGRPVRVFNTHLAERRQEAVRARQVPVLAEEIARHDRAIVLGDFNAVPDSPELRPIRPLATDADPRCRPSAGGACAPTTDWQSKFDYVFLRGIASRAHHVRPSAHSDHHMFYADLSPL
ncbi:endonuclease/exonuclease/phosphatase family protein [Streptomyces sp. NPDC088785]|uniref:endonuclease/exonuclease/phosphatase family protein n=1 Tax=Streptomyces sp. NPDC088785 TaxID=3365897 RepID=UPI0038251EEC